MSLLRSTTKNPTRLVPKTTPKPVQACHAPESYGGPSPGVGWNVRCRVMLRLIWRQRNRSLADAEEGNAQQRQREQKHERQHEEEPHRRVDERRIQGSPLGWRMVYQQGDIGVEEQQENEPLEDRRNEEPLHHLFAIKLAFIHGTHMRATATQAIAHNAMVRFAKTSEKPTPLTQAVYTHTCQASTIEDSLATNLRLWLARHYQQQTVPQLPDKYRSNIRGDSMRVGRYRCGVESRDPAYNAPRGMSNTHSTGSRWETYREKDSLPTRTLRLSRCSRAAKEASEPGAAQARGTRGRRDGRCRWGACP